MTKREQQIKVVNDFCRYSEQFLAMTDRPLAWSYDDMQKVIDKINKCRRKAFKLGIEKIDRIWHGRTAKESGSKGFFSAGKYYKLDEIDLYLK